MTRFAQICILCVLCLSLLMGGPMGCAGYSAGGTPILTPSPVPTRIPASPAPSNTPTPAPTASPAPEMTFVADPANPLPGNRARVTGPYTLSGTVVSNVPITKVSVLLACDYNESGFYPYEKTVTLPVDSGVCSYTLTDAENTLEGASLNDLVAFEALQNGLHTLILTAYTETQPDPFTLAVHQFFVLNGPWKRLSADDFLNSYDETAAFFGGRTERFLYRYQPGYGRYIVADPDWEDAYITGVQADEGAPWLVHVDAVPYYEKAVHYLHTVHVRVHGTNGDTGVLPLMQLIDGYYGSYVSRFTSGKKYVSHHGFGTATDINATMAPNGNTKANQALIHREVDSLLAYNGILTENGIAYYDFTYSGQYACSMAGVPETVVNYLLYELAFYRAGFLWGHYYRTTSDGMHFTLTDQMYYSHDGGYGLRKVFAYAED